MPQIDTAASHPGIQELARYFDYEHLTRDDLKDISRHVFDLAQYAVHELPDNTEKTAGLRKLLEAKDCFVRSAI